jgi:zinc D-Ala-D-Ala carboxypeptidase
MQDDNFIGPPKPEWKLSDKLSPHFTLDELTRSQTAVRNNIDNTPQDIDIERLQALCENALEPIRVHFNKSVIISSGFRAPELNTAIGGSTTSQHCIGEAADFIVADVPLRETWE